MEKKLSKKSVIARKIELEERLMDLIEISTYYDNLLAVIYEIEINDILEDLECLEGV